MKNRVMRFVSIVCLIGMSPAIVLAGETEAVAISQTIQKYHSPFGTIIDPVYASPTSDEIVNYSRGGDAAIWTGHYVAAEAFRYRVTRSQEALNNVFRGLKAIRGLEKVTGTGVLARCRVRVDWEETTDHRAIITEEAGHGVYRSTLKGKDWYWIGDTSRDQYIGVFFGLGVAYEFVDEAAHPKVRPLIRKIATELLDNLIEHDWAVVMPNGQISTTFAGRADQRLALLQVGRFVHDSVYTSKYLEDRSKHADLVPLPIALETLEQHESYYKFNLDYLCLYSLLRYEEKDSPDRKHYQRAYDILRLATHDHGNAHFNTIDRALSGPNVTRDYETQELLAAWLRRPRRDDWVDLRCCVILCGDDRSCLPIVIEDRVRTDFLWQRSPFLAYGGGYGLIEGPGIDYILPYWMDRYLAIAV